MIFSFASLIEVVKNNNLKHKLNLGRYIVWRTGGSIIQKEVMEEY
jgi:D-serine dehydratase